MSRIQLQRQDTFDLRDQIHADDHSHLQAHADAAVNYTDDEEHSVLEDDSEGEEQEEYMDDDDDGSSSLSIPNESIDFDLVYSLHSFAATVEGQANVVKGDSLFLMDDSNSYWWLVRVLKTQEVGYIPAENIETPFERLARLNKHRNVDLASATQTELQEGQIILGDRLRTGLTSRVGSSKTPSPAGRRSRQNKGVQFTPTLSVHRYLPAVWKEEEMSDEEDVEWDDEGYEDEDQGLAIEQMQRRREEEELGPGNMEPDDGMQWDDSVTEDIQIRQVLAANTVPIPDALQPGSQREQLQQQQLRAQQQQQLQAQQQQLMAQQQQQAVAQQAVVQQGPQQQQQALRTVSSRERLNASPASQGPRPIDPAEATETRKLTVTPNIARDTDERPAGQPYLPSQIIGKQQEEERTKRQREEDAVAADEASKRKKGKEKMAPPVSSASLAKPQQPPPGKLRKEPSRDSQEEETKDKDKKKKSSVFSGLFSRKKEKAKDRGRSASIGSMESGEYTARGSEDSSRSGGQHRPNGNGNGSPGDGTVSPTTAVAIQQQKQQQQQALNNARAEPAAAAQNQVAAAAPATPERGTALAQVSPHASQLRQRDQHQQALYQQYLNRSPSSPPEAQPSYGLQSASAVMSYTSSSSSSGSALGPPTSRPRPGSLILTASSMDGPGPGVPELSVIRVFAGKHLQTEATFKTVLLNNSTTSSDLVRQALQRFRLPAGEDEDDYYLTIKEVGGGASAVLEAKEKPLVVFETLVVEAMEVPKVKRSSVGSISSIASNLSMHPAIKKLSMNDFTDDSAVKFYLNRKRRDGVDDSDLLIRIVVLGRTMNTDRKSVV